MNLRDTIAAISTPPGRGGLGVIRISGPQALAVAEKTLRLNSPCQSWRAQLAELLDAEANIVDQVVVTFFAAPRSYTAEDVVEISCHGAPVVLRHALDRACSYGARLAEPGEFTLRAFLNGRIDLPQAEAVRDLIDATTLYQARIAAQQVDGAVSRRLQPLKDQLIELIALLEAGIDFAEDDIDVAPDAEILRRLAPLEAGIGHLIRGFSYGQLVHNGFTLAIAGRPNAGKSSLFNRLLEQDRAIVTAIPGTTRDLVSESASIEGIPVRFVDTAGIRESHDLVEKLGIDRSHQAMADADLTLNVVDLTDPQPPLDCPNALLVGNKSDLNPEASINCIRVSALTGEGIPELRRRIIETLCPEGQIPRESGFLTSLRHERLLKEANEALAHARAALGHRLPHEMLLLDLYAALAPLDAITGATTADDILNRIFSTFCIGK